jgi:hypothetical protein
MRELKDKHESPEVTESREIVQQGEQDNEQPGFEEDGPTRWSTDEGGDEPKTLDWYKEQARTRDYSTDRDQAVFYSGKDPVWENNPFPKSEKGKSRDIAERYAEITGKTTLEMTPGGDWLDKQNLYEKFPDNKKQVNEVWAIASERFAQGVSGEVVTFSSSFRPDSTDGIWAKTEKKQLENSSDVTKIDEV